MSLTVIIAPQLFTAISELPAKDQARVVDFISTFQANPAHPSLSLERLNKAKSKGVWSGRVGRGIRAILYKDGDVWAIPGPVDAPTSRGTNRLLSEGAGVATDPEVVLEELARTGPVPEPLAALSQPEQIALARPERRILALLAEGPLTRDALARRLESPGDALALDLLELELAGRVVEDRDGRLRLVSREGR